MTVDDDRLRRALQTVVPTIPPIDPAGIMAHKSRPRRKLAIVGAVVVVAGVAVAIAVVSRSDRSAPDKAATPTHTLGQLTHRAPCPPPRSATLATRAELRAFGAVAAVQCYEKEQIFPDGEWSVIVRQVTTSGVAEFLRALDQPDQPRSRSLCAGVFVGGPWLSLVNRDGDYLFPRFPLSGCGQPQADLVDKLSHWHVVSTRKDVQQRTPAELATHCEPRRTNEIYLRESEGRAEPITGHTPVLNYPQYKTLRACIYRVSSRDHSVGAFVRGLSLDPRDAAAARRALAGPAPTSRCADQRTFAIVRLPITSGDSVNVEMGGCWRVLRDGKYGTANAGVLKGLLGMP